MSPQSLVTRVEKLEERVTVLEQLPDPMDNLALQISQLRDEVRGGFSALTEEIRRGDEETLRQMRQLLHESEEETRLQMRILHEDVIARFALLQEGIGRQDVVPSRRTPRRKKHK